MLNDRNSVAGIELKKHITRQMREDQAPRLPVVELSPNNCLREVFLRYLQLIEKTWLIDQDVFGIGVGLRKGV